MEKHSSCGKGLVLTAVETSFLCVRTQTGCRIRAESSFWISFPPSHGTISVAQPIPTHVPGQLGVPVPNATHLRSITSSGTNGEPQQSQRQRGPPEPPRAGPVPETHSPSTPTFSREHPAHPARAPRLQPSLENPSGLRLHPSKHRGGGAMVLLSPQATQATDAQTPNPPPAPARRRATRPRGGVSASGGGLLTPAAAAVAKGRLGRGG